MVVRVLHGIAYDVESPSFYRSRDWPDVHIFYEGLAWVLTDGRYDESYLSLDAAARRFRAAADLAMRDAQHGQP